MEPDQRLAAACSSVSVQISSVALIRVCPRMVCASRVGTFRSLSSEPTVCRRWWTLISRILGHHRSGGRTGQSLTLKQHREILVHAG